MYFLDFGFLRIYRVDLDGRERKTIVNTGLQQPRGLTIGEQTAEAKHGAPRAWVI